MLIQSFLYIPTIVVLIALAIMIWRKQPDGSAHRVFSLLVLTTSLWLFFWYLAEISSQAGQALYFIRLSRIFSPWIAYLFLMFCVLFPVKTGHMKLWAAVSWWPALFLSATAFSPGHIASVDLSGFATQPIQVGHLNFLYFIYNVLYFLSAFSLLLSKLKRVTLLQRSQIKLILTTTFLTIVVNVVLIVFPHAKSLDLVAIMSTPTVLIAALGVTYAIAYLDLFDIRALIYRSLIHVAPYLRQSKEETLFTLQTLVAEADTDHVALDFSDVEELDPAVARNLAKLKEIQKQQLGKNLYFIRCSPSVREALSVNEQQTAYT